MALIAVLDYGIGNLHSAQKALQHVGADARLTADPALIRDAAGVVLPGVGNFGRCMQALEESGLDELAIECAGSGRPFLGVCVGMQMLYEGSEESPEIPGLGVLPGIVRRLPDGVKRPQMQWNLVVRTRPSGLLDGLPDRLASLRPFAEGLGPPFRGAAINALDYGAQLIRTSEPPRDGVVVEVRSQLKSVIHS